MKRGTMAHIPINHHLQPVYRVLAGLIGLYLLAFGILSFTQHSSIGFFAHYGGKQVLGMKGNPAFSVLAIALGALVIIGAVIGRNVDHHINIWVAITLLVIGTAMLALLRTDLNVLGFSLMTVVVVYGMGMLLMAAGLYGKVGTSEQAEAEEQFRHA
jgi:hypothetical protein